jgi:hypothetical protein
MQEDPYERPGFFRLRENRTRNYEEYDLLRLLTN